MVRRFWFGITRIIKSPSRIILQEELFRLRDMSSDGLTGISRVTQHREAIGLAQSQEEQAGRMSKGLKPVGALKTDQNLGDEAKKKLKEQFDDAYEDASTKVKTVVLEKGLEWQAIGLTAQDAQLLESRKFSVTEIARI